MYGARLALGVIPARAQSSRFPRKVLAEIAGKPMIQYVWEAAAQARMLGDLVVATDDEAIASRVRQFGGKAVLTPPQLPSGSDRVAFVAADRNFPLVVNVQGDEPLVTAKMIDSLVQELEGCETRDIATLAVKRNGGEELRNPNVVKVVVSRSGEALYFSRHPLAIDPSGAFLKHIGIYAYRREVLLRTCEMPPSPLELTERLEQLRALQNGLRIQVVMTETDTIAVDTPEDLRKVEQFLLGGGPSEVYNRDRGCDEN